jgi:hypothetical protein
LEKEATTPRSSFISLNLKGTWDPHYIRDLIMIVLSIP